MMNKKETVGYCLNALKKAGADKAACSLNINEKKELNVEIGEMALLRTTFNNNMGISVIKDQKKGSTFINKTDKESIDSAVTRVMEMAKGSQTDEAYDIAQQQPAQSFSKGDESANLDSMYLYMCKLVLFYLEPFQHCTTKNPEACIEIVFSLFFFKFGKLFSNKKNNYSK